MPAAKKILIVDDEKPMAHALELKLQHSGFDTKVAYLGSDALSLLDKEKYNLILLDLMMPSPDGFAVLETLQKKKNTIPVIVTTNLSQLEDEKRAMTLGAKKYFVKSNTPLSEIIDHVKKILKV